MNLFKSILVLPLLAVTTLSLAQETRKAIGKKNEATMLSFQTSDLFIANKPKEAYAKLAEFWTAEEKENAIKLFTNTFTKFGKPSFVIKIKDENLSDMIYEETYALKFDSNVIRLIYTYYSNNNKFYIINFKWDKNFDNNWN